MTDVVPLMASHVDEATAMCVRAFDDYPFLEALFPGSSARRAHVSAAFYGATVRDCLRHGRVDAVRGAGRWRVIGTCRSRRSASVRFGRSPVGGG